MRPRYLSAGALSHRRCASKDAAHYLILKRAKHILAKIRIPCHALTIGPGGAARGAAKFVEARTLLGIFDKQLKNLSFER
jgi:hypothetical protein